MLGFVVFVGIVAAVAYAFREDIAKFFKNHDGA